MCRKNFFLRCIERKSIPSFLPFLVERLNETYLEHFASWSQILISAMRAKPREYSTFHCTLLIKSIIFVVTKKKKREGTESLCATKTSYSEYFCRWDLCVNWVTWDFYEWIFNWLKTNSKIINFKDFFKNKFKFSSLTHAPLQNSKIFIIYNFTSASRKEKKQKTRKLLFLPKYKLFYKHTTRLMDLQ